MRTAMEAERLDALVLRLPENVLLLSGFWPMIGATVLVFPLHGSSVCIIPSCYEQEAAKSLWDSQTVFYGYGVLEAPDPALAVQNSLSAIARSKSWKRVGYEANFEVVAPSWNSAEFLVPAAQTQEMLAKVFDGSEVVDVSALLQTQRLRKTAYEIEKLRVASEISCLGLEAFEKLVEVGITGVELAAAVEHEVMVWGTKKGAYRVRAFAQVAVGPDETAVGYRPNEVSTLLRMKAGDVALLELGLVVDGYWADRTRVRVAGQPTDEQFTIFQAVRKAQEAATAAIKPGVAAAHVDEAARSVIREAGYAEYFPHVTGHGLGFRYHESSPILAPQSAAVLEQGNLTSVEPGIYKKRVGGFRIEDDVLVTATGAEVFGRFPKNLV
ncbi:MAG: Xaa-Pro peptidase family protein [Candidatus Acidiferrales bacterium]